MTKEIPIELFPLIEKCVDDACAEAARIKLSCCANLSRLSCVDVIWCYRDEDDRGSWIEVVVSHATPDCMELINFIIEYCLKNCGHEIQVRTEW